MEVNLNAEWQAGNSDRKRMPSLRWCLAARRHFRNLSANSMELEKPTADWKEETDYVTTPVDPRCRASFRSSGFARWSRIVRRRLRRLEWWRVRRRGRGAPAERFRDTTIDAPGAGQSLFRPRGVRRRSALPS